MFLQIYSNKSDIPAVLRILKKSRRLRTEQCAVKYFHDGRLRRHILHEVKIKAGARAARLPLHRITIELFQRN
jgi:hypothetical protein